MTAPLLALSDVSAGYAKSPVIYGISITVNAGASLAIVGPNAAGKSTILRAACGSSPITSGNVKLGGVDIATMPGDARARAVAVVPQSARFDLDFSVREVVSFGRSPHHQGWGFSTPEDERIVAACLDRTELNALAGRHFRELSGGERQRVLLARALAQGSSLLLLDEPTAHLDLAHQLLVLDIVQRQTTDGGACVVVLHDLAMAARMSRVAIVSAGTVVAVGPPQETLTPARLRSVWGVEGELAFERSGPILRLFGPSKSEHGEAPRGS